jgi:hypothetical protein
LHGRLFCHRRWQARKRKHDQQLSQKARQRISKIV